MNAGVKRLFLRVAAVTIIVYESGLLYCEKPAEIRNGKESYAVIYLEGGGEGGGARKGRLRLGVTDR